MDSTSLTLLGLIAGAITSLGFIPQLVKGYTTKKLDDVSFSMPVVLSVGMTLWLLYGIFLEAIAIILANAFGVSCCLILIVLKKRYS